MNCECDSIDFTSLELNKTHALFLFAISSPCHSCEAAKHSELPLYKCPSWTVLTFGFLKKMWVVESCHCLRFSNTKRDSLTYWKLWPFTLCRVQLMQMNSWSKTLWSTWVLQGSSVSDNYCEPFWLVAYLQRANGSYVCFNINSLAACHSKKFPLSEAVGHVIKEEWTSL